MRITLHYEILTEVTEAFSFEVLILLTLCSKSPNVLHLPVMLIRDKGEPRLGVRAIHSFSFTVAQIWIEYLRLMNYQAIWAARFANTPSSSVY
ncbi:hypothetical protein P692DRAFT_20168323 [Suillus brevipes Sb2]|nr:hypothetical protein P692DRAFT_20168323 [Suillus brevipes Sb2]